MFYFIDIHIPGVNPKNRKYSFIDTVETRLIKVVNLVDKYNVDLSRPITKISW